MRMVSFMPRQVVNGKAFEYACLNAVESALRDRQEVEIIKNDALITAHGFYQCMDDEQRNVLDKAAKAACNVLLRLEPQLDKQSHKDKLLLSLQEDAAGQDGDVRDLVMVRNENGWEIGLSCKHNHEAVKHSRLSATLDFGAKWLGLPCSEEYFNNISGVFEKLRNEKSKGTKWSEIDSKELTVYKPVLDAFKKELIAIDENNHNKVPQELVKYLIGRNDFYKVIAKENNRLTEVQAYNLYGTLNQADGKFKPRAKLEKLPLPSKILDFSYKEQSNNTLVITFDRGWSVSLRIHNASSKVEPSLKFDVQIVGFPRELFKTDADWEE